MTVRLDVVSMLCAGIVHDVVNHIRLVILRKNIVCLLLKF